MKKIDLNIKQLRMLNKNPDWQRGLLAATLLSLGIFALFLGYLLIKPINKEIKAIIDEEISSTDIIFDQKTIETLKKRQEPATLSAPAIGKNPFIPF